MRRQLGCCTVPVTQHAGISAEMGRLGAGRIGWQHARLRMPCMVPRPLSASAQSLLQLPLYFALPH